jgi:hypothetical protein
MIDMTCVDALQNARRIFWRAQTKFSIKSIFFQGWALEAAILAAD